MFSVSGLDQILRLAKLEIRDLLQPTSSMAKGMPWIRHFGIVDVAR